MRNYTKDSRCVWGKTICGGLPFQQAGRPDNGNYLDGGDVISDKRQKTLAPPVIF
jgi:hypothetical protein